MDSEITRKKHSNRYFKQNIINAETGNRDKSLPDFS